MINFKVRAKNVMFWVSIVIAIFTPILAYMGIAMQDLTTWAKVGEIIVQAVSNPYVVILMLVSVYNAIVDPTTKGIKDSKQAMTYERPKE